MTEILPVFSEAQAKHTSQPFDILEALYEPQFIKACIDAERQLDSLNASRSERLEQIRDEHEFRLNEMLDSDAYMYLPVIATSTALAGHETVSIKDMPLRYGGIQITPDSKKEKEKYRAVFRLLPIDRITNAIEYFAPLDAITKLAVPSYQSPEFNPDNMMALLKDILERSRRFRSEGSFQKKSQIEKMTDIEDLADMYTVELASFIDQDMPLFISSDRYAAYKSSVKKKLTDERSQLTPDTTKRHIIAGRLVEITFRSLFAINPNVPPILVLQNTHEGTRYEIPLDAAISHMIPLHATVCH